MRQVFVIAPGRGVDSAYLEKRAVVDAVCARASWLPVYDNFDPADPRFDIGTLTSRIAASSLVFADVSFERPSCYFELGAAEALGARVFLVARVGTVVHQTSFASSVHQYETLSDFATLVERAIGL